MKRILIFILLLLSVASFAQMRDPTQPSGAAMAGEQGGAIDSIIVSESRPNMVMINGETFHVGDVVDGAKIVGINDDHVIFSDESGKFSVEIHHDIKKSITKEGTK